MWARTTIIAEAGVNHDGDIDKAVALVEAAAHVGADIVKFQTFKAATLAARSAPKAAYQERATGGGENQLEMLRRLELPDEAFGLLLGHADRIGIAMLSTPFDEASLELLIALGLRRIKIGSGDLTNAPLLLKLARADRDVILSSGMATLAELEEALGVLAYGYSGASATPSRQSFGEAWRDPVTRSVVQRRVTVLHCTTEYPCPPADINLAAMDTIRQSCGVAVGYSDHSEDIAVAIAAVARGATIIEKHFTLDRNASGPDHAASIEPPRFRAMVDAIRTVEIAVGDGVKEPRPSEVPNMSVARKCLVASRPIKAGELFSERNLAVKRAGVGVPPVEYWDRLGRSATRAYEIDEVIDP